MAIISIDNLEPGMVLAADVKDRSGRPLLAAGNTISDRTLRIFKMWGVLEADIEGVVQEEVAARQVASLPPEAVHQAEEHMASLFRHTDGEHPVIKELFRLSTIRAARKLEESNGSAIKSA